LRQAPPELRREQLLAHLGACVGRILEIADPAAIDPERGFFEMGMDSLLAMELKSRLEADLECRLPSTLAFNYPTLAALADYLLANAACQPATPEPRPQTQRPEPITLAAARPALDDLSEEALATLLRQKLERFR
jgi:acyl carrier protein